jgi:hypothetical protein
MATTKRRQSTDDERAQRRRHEQELTERAVAQLRCGDGWQRWLRVRGRLGLRRYSLIISGRVRQERLSAELTLRRHVADTPRTGPASGSACGRRRRIG